MFPSPCGDYGSYQSKKEKCALKGADVSVPLRGLWFLSCRGPRRLSAIRACFRPLAGIMVLIFSEHPWFGLPVPVSVPLRGLWFLSAGTAIANTGRNPVSVPLRGLWFLSKITALKLTTNSNKQVSVPLRGLWFLSEYRNLIVDYHCNRFPSPCGDYGSYQTALF